MSNPNLSELGLMTPNEVRKMLGLEPYTIGECPIKLETPVPWNVRTEVKVEIEAQQAKPWTPTKCVDLTCGWRGPSGKTINRIGSSIGDCPRCGLPCKMNPVTTGNTTDEGEGSNT